MFDVKDYLLLGVGIIKTQSQNYHKAIPYWMDPFTISGRCQEGVRKGSDCVRNVSGMCQECGKKVSRMWQKGVSKLLGRCQEGVGKVSDGLGNSV